MYMYHRIVKHFIILHRKLLNLSFKMGLDSKTPTLETYIHLGLGLCLQGFANNKGTNQPAHPQTLISAFVIRFFYKYHM